MSELTPSASESASTSTPSPRQPSPDEPYAAFRLPNFRLYILSSITGVLGAQIQAVAVGWEIWERTHEPEMLAYAGLAQVLPFILFGLIAGQIADWYSRKVLIMISHVMSIVCAASMAYVSYYEAPVEWFFLILFVRGASSTLGMPSRQALLPQIVPQRLFSNAIAWNSGTFHLALVIGPAIGGVILQKSPLYAYLSDAIGLILAFICVAFIRPQESIIQREPLTVQGVLAGVKFIWKTEVILAILSLDLFATLLGGATALLPIYAEVYLDCGAQGLGWLRAATGLGSLVMAMLLVYLPPMKQAGRTLLYMMVGFGLATIGFGYSTNFWLSCFFLFWAGAFDQVNVVVRQTLLQVLSPAALRGRISAVNSIFIGISNRLGEYESGMVAAWTSPVFSVVSGGVGSVIVVFIVAMKWPQISQIKRLDDVKPEQEQKNGLPESDMQ